MRFRILLPLWAGLVVLRPEPAAADHLTLTTVANRTVVVAGEVMLVEAYRRLGIDVTVRKYPAERALRLADRGLVDGEVVRMDALREQYPNLIQVRPAMYFVEASAFATRADFEPAGWDSLRPYRIGIVRGVKLAENNTVGMNRHLVSDFDTLFRMLERDRLEIALTLRTEGLLQIRRARLDTVRELTPPVARVNVYHYLNKKRADLVPRIATALEKMKATGELEEIRRHVSEVLSDRAARGLSICDDGLVCPELYALERNVGN